MKYLAGFHTFLGVAGVAAQTVQIYQAQQMIMALRDIQAELAAHSSFMAPETFAKQVYRCIKTMAKDTRDSPEHFYFVYHPDNDWHGAFDELVENKPLPASYFGMSNCLDLLCVWMQFLRNSFARNGKWGKRAVFHLLVPAYHPLVIEEALEFSERLHPLRIHGLVNGGNRYVKMNLHDAKPNMLDCIDIWRKPASIWPWSAPGVEIPRVLGLPEDAEDIVLGVDNRRVHRRRR
jgi:hypothetical protein